ncbi:GTPase family protein [Aeromonas salmonicida]|uniref:GTPase family protein n=1 Tax=Aeromonas salmonicida TaxID=645 RepID=UPI0038D0D238
MDPQQSQDQLVQEIIKKVAAIRSYTPKVGIFGNSGVGKSSLCNALFGKEIAKISDVEACTRERQDILIGSENGGITLVDVPGIGEDPTHQEEYTALYKSLAPELDLVLWAIKADDRNYASALDSYKEVFSLKENTPPVLFVITQVDKTNDMEDWNYQEYRPDGTQKGNIALKELDVSKRFEVCASNVISVAVSKKGKSYNLKELVELVVKALPNEKKFSFTREAKQENVSEEARKEAEKGIWDSVKEFADEAWDSVKDKVVDIIIASAPKIISSIGKWFKSWF